MSKRSLLLAVFLLPASAWMFSQAPRNVVKVDVSQIPASLSLNEAYRKGEVNQTLSVTVSLRNALGTAVAAVKDEKVQLHYGGQVTEGVIPAGASSTTFQITPRSAGIARIEASGANLAGASGILAIDKSKGSIERVSVQPSPPPPPAGSNVESKTARKGLPRVMVPAAVAASSPVAPSSSPQLKIFVTPDNVAPDPESGLWRAQVALALMGPNDELISSDRDLQLELITQQGQINPPQVTIKKDESSTFGTPVILTSNSAGMDVVSALSSLPRVEQTVTYLTPKPSQLRLDATPASVINDGRSPIRIVILLEDANRNIVRSPAATQITLTSTRGNIAPLTLTIPPGEFSAEAALTSEQNGVARVTAEASSLESGQISAAFLFPWMLVAMGALGGILGASVHSPKSVFSSQWWKVLALGVICGVVLSVAALVGAIGALPRLGLPVQISQIPSANELGALLLGFIGGFYGKKLWSRGDSDKPDQAATTTAGKTG